MAKSFDRAKTGGWDFWSGVRLFAGLLVVLPNGYFRLQPVIADLVGFFGEYGAFRTVETVVPLYARTLWSLYGWRLGWSAVLLAFSFGYAAVAGKALYILLTKAILKMGFRAEEAGQHHLLHPQGEA